MKSLKRPAKETKECHQCLQCSESCFLSILTGGTQYCEDVYFYGRLCYCNVIGVPTPQNGTTCTDFDECSVNNGGCEQTCSNNVGSFTCSCASGYLLSDNGLTCEG